MEAQLQRSGWKAAAVHGDASQQQRTRAVEQFKVTHACCPVNDFLLSRSRGY